MQEIIELAIAKATKELYFKSKYSLGYGIQELKKLLEEKRIKNFNDPRYTNQKYLEMFKEKNIIWNQN